MPVDSTVEIDFFQRERQINYCSPSSRRPCSERVGSSCRRIQDVVSRINPVLLKTVMAGEAAAAGAQAWCAGSTGLWTPGRPLKSSYGLPSSPSASPTETGRTLQSPHAAGLNLASRSAGGARGHPETTPLTIFYNGTVTAFDVTSDEAEAIIRMAEHGLMVEQPEESLLDDHPAEGDLPIARRKSLQRFLEKRKERRGKAPANEHYLCSSLSVPRGASFQTGND